MGWIITYTALNQINLINPTIVRKHLCGPDTYLICTSTTPGLPQGWNQTKVVSVKDVTQIASLASGISGLGGVILDIEGWTDTPSNQKTDKATVIATYASGYSFCQSNGLKLIATPGIDLIPTIDPTHTGPFYPRWINLGMYTDLAPYCDVMELQGQGTQNTLTAYTSFIASGAAQVRAVNPEIEIIAGITTTPAGGSTTIDQMTAAAESIRDVTQSFWLNVPGSSTTGLFPLGEQFLRRYFPENAPPPDGLPTVSYTYAVGPHLGGPQWGFDPRDPQFNFYLSGQAHDFSCTLDAESQAGMNVTEITDDVWCWRNGELIFRGPVVNIADTGDENEHTFQMTANSYRYRLTRFYTNLNAALGSGAYSVGTHNGPDNAWTLINGHLGSSAATGQTDLFGKLIKGSIYTPSSTTFAGVVQTGTDIASSVDALAQVQAFDWDIIPNDSTGNLEFTAWQPGRGSARPDVVFAYIRGNAGTNCKFERTLDVSNFANRVYVNGQNSSGTQWIKSAQASYGAQGRYTWIEDASDLSATASGDLDTLLQNRANTLLIEKQTPAPAYTITPNEGLWDGPDSLWLGDQPTLLIRSGRLSDVHTELSVNQITLAPANGGDGMSFTAGAEAFGQYGQKALARGLRDMSKRLRTVEWTKATRGA